MNSDLPIRTAAVLGAGVMGAQIAAHLANAGMTVHLLDMPEKGKPNARATAAIKMLSKMKPAALTHPNVARRIIPGNFDDDMSVVANCEWVIEAVVERLDVKQALFEKVDAHRQPNTIVSSNTSGLSVNALAASCTAGFKSHFLGVHFFNPPRYQRLLEVIATQDTDSGVIKRIEHIGRRQLGKGIVHAKDTPNFIGNRIGIYALALAMKPFLDGKLRVEEVDALTGPLLGRPKSATFRTVDVVGLDVYAYVSNHLYDTVDEDPMRAIFQVPPLVEKMIEGGKLGAKVKAGFYSKPGKLITVINPETLEYEATQGVNLPHLDVYCRISPFSDRLKALYADDGIVGETVKSVLLPLFSYCAQRMGDITDSIVDIDKAMKWGFAWKYGPFELWSMLGISTVMRDMEEADLVIPEWVTRWANKGETGFYTDVNKQAHIVVPSTGQTEALRKPSDEITVQDLRVTPGKTIHDYGDALLLDAGDGVTVFTFTTKANVITSKVMEGLHSAIDLVEMSDYKALLIANDEELFSAGANLKEMREFVAEDNFPAIDNMIQQFQSVCQKIHYAGKPVITVVQDRAFGGGCELTMASPFAVASSETYIGLVELGVGVIPAGCGTMRMAKLAEQRAIDGTLQSAMPFLRHYFETVAKATVSSSAEEAKALGYLPPETRIVMNRERRLSVAKLRAMHLYHAGYKAQPNDGVLVLGRGAKAQLDTAIYNMQQGGFISAYDAHLCQQLAHVITGGDLDGPVRVTEQYMLDLERRVFLELLREEKTLARIDSILTTNKPLRN